MIKVSVNYQHDNISSSKVKGHAQYEEYGKDLICASVSSIMFGLMNALDMCEGSTEIKMADNEIEIILKDHSQVVEDYLSLVLIQLKTIEESYSQYIKIDERRKK